MKNWEYETVRVENKSPGRLIKALNEMGETGWELVTHSIFNDPHQQESHLLIFKRRGKRWWQYL